MNEIDRYDFHTKTTKFIGDSQGIEYFIGIDDAYDDLLAESVVISFDKKQGDEFVGELKALALVEARKWLKKH